MPDASKPDASKPDASKPDASPPGASPPAAKPVPPKPAKKPAVMETEPWEGPLADALRNRFGEAVSLYGIYRGQAFIEIGAEAVSGILEFLKNEEAFDYLVDLTAVHRPDKEKPFEIVWILYSFAKNTRLRVKASVADGGKIPSVAALYSSADWAEREAYDMFGVEFENHPDLKRILMPDEWEGFPLRKEYDIIRQDEDWVRENLKIESAQ